MQGSFIKKAASLLIIAICLISIEGCEARADSDIPLSDRISNSRELIYSIRHGLKNHASSITISFDYGSDIFSELNDVTDKWVELALAETDDPAEGDYIRYQYGGYTISSSYLADGDRYKYTVNIVPQYYTYLSNEQEVDKRVKELMSDFDFTRRTSDYEKIEAIYGYLCQNVSYDRVHRKNPYFHKKSTAYAALILNTATCQGYCTALYRLLREAGISCRIVTGSAPDEELHSWVIAELDGRYYNLDPTWDAGSDEYRFLLVGSNGLGERVLSDKFETDEFKVAYQISDTDYK